MFRNLVAASSYLLVFIFVIFTLVVSLTHLFEQYYFHGASELIRQGEQLNRILAETGEEQWKYGLRAGAAA